MCGQQGPTGGTNHPARREVQLDVHLADAGSQVRSSIDTSLPGVQLGLIMYGDRMEQLVQTSIAQG